MEERSRGLEILLRGEQGRNPDVVGSPETGDRQGCKCVWTEQSGRGQKCVAHLPFHDLWWLDGCPKSESG